MISKIGKFLFEKTSETVSNNEIPGVKITLQPLSLKCKHKAYHVHVRKSRVDYDFVFGRDKQPNEWIRATPPLTKKQLEAIERFCMENRLSWKNFVEFGNPELVTKFALSKFL